jgi:hypothetical protein
MSGMQFIREVNVIEEKLYSWLVKRKKRKWDGLHHSMVLLHPHPFEIFTQSQEQN